MQTTVGDGNQQVALFAISQQCNWVIALHHEAYLKKLAMLHYLQECYIRHIEYLAFYQLIKCVIKRRMRLLHCSN